MKFVYAEGATPLDIDQLNGLIPDHISTQHELNAWEAQNILEAQKWLLFSRPETDVLNTILIKNLHKKMFNQTWAWAGEFRKNSTNIGVEPHRISSDVKTLLDDVQFWMDHNTFDIDEIAVRLHHRLVFIHCFSNGNGRHSRLYTDLFLKAQNVKTFSWGSQSLEKDSHIRKAYINALRAADNQEYSLLIDFVRS